MENKEIKLIGGASFIYALMFVFCLYQCTSGFTNILWMISTVIFMLYIAVKLEKKWTRMNTFISMVLVLLGMSNMSTGDGEIIFFNYVVIIVLVCVNILFLHSKEKMETVLKSLGRLINAAVRIMGNMGKPFSHSVRYIKLAKIKENEKARYILIGVVSAVPIAAFVVVLLTSADGVFREGLRRIFNFGNSVVTTIEVLLIFIIGYMISYAAALFLKQDVEIAGDDGKKITALPVTIVTAVVTGVYVIFSIVQILYLFIGKGTLPPGYTYAEYAREGFFQLLFLSAINIVVVLICMELVEKSKILKILLYPFCVCTIIMAFSSAYRMKMYISEYGLTAMRIYVLWALGLMIAIVAGMILKLMFKKMNLFYYCVVICCMCFLILSYSHKDYFIAKYNFSRYDKMCEIEEKSERQNEENDISEDLYEEQDENSDKLYEYVDMEYLMELSTDAAPAMVEYKKEIEEYMRVKEWNWTDFDWCYIEWGVEGEIHNHLGIRNFNISRWYSRKCLDELQK